MARVTMRAFAKLLDVSHTHIHRLIVRGIIERGADGLIDVDIARQAVESSKSVAHGYLAEVNERQRAAHRGAPAAETISRPPVSTPTPLVEAPRKRAKNRKSRSPAEPTVDVPIDPGPAPDPAVLTAATATRRNYETARSERERAAADLARLDYQRRSGELVERTLAERVLFKCAREARDAWMQFPTRAAPLIATAIGLADPEVLRQALAEHVANQLERLGAEIVDFDDPDR